MFDFSQVRWLRVIIGAGLVLVVGFLIATLIVTVYAAGLGFQARGAPDQNLINQFANTLIPTIAPVLALVGTFGVAWFAVRKLGAAAFTNALLIGLLAGVISTISNLIGGFNPMIVLEFFMFLVGGALAGWLVSRGSVKQSPV